ncbi:hypothetical protein AB0A73_24600 [Glycomyces sp. NPDC047369]
MNFEILFLDLEPLSASERARLEARRVKLQKMRSSIEKASTALRQIPTADRLPPRLLVREAFARRTVPAPATDRVSDRRPLPRQDRPPATRLVSPNGIALKTYLLAMYIAQTRPEGRKTRNTIPIDAEDRVSWVSLLATPATPLKGRYSLAPRDKTRRQLMSALKRLSSPEVQLVRLPNSDKSVGKYEEFELLHERGAPLDGGINDERYTVPVPGKNLLLSLPSGLLQNGWIHLLEDSEIAFLLMVSWLHARYKTKDVFIDSDRRLLQFGLSRDAYESHRFLRRCGLIDVDEDPRRHLEGGRVTDYAEDPNPRLHRFTLLKEGFQQSAAETIEAVITRRIGRESPR